MFALILLLALLSAALWCAGHRVRPTPMFATEIWKLAGALTVVTLALCWCAAFGG